MRPHPTARLLACALLLSVAGCAARPPLVVQSFPASADLTVEPKPLPPIEALTSEKAAADYDVSLEAWGTRGWQTVARVCQWAKASGAKVDCPTP